LLAPSIVAAGQLGTDSAKAVPTEKGYYRK